MYLARVEMSETQFEGTAATYNRVLSRRRQELAAVIQQLDAARATLEEVATRRRELQGAKDQLPSFRALDGHRYEINPWPPIVAQDRWSTTVSVKYVER